MAIWTATNVSLPSNSRIVTVNTGDDVGQMYTGFIIQINDLQFNTVRTVNTGASPQTIELDELYTGTAITGGSAIGAPTQGAIKEAAEELRQLRTTYEGLANSVNESATANSLVRRTAQGRVKAANGVAVDDCVTMSQIGTAAARDVGTSSGNVMEVGAFGLGGLAPTVTDANQELQSGIYSGSGSAGVNFPTGMNFGVFFNAVRANNTAVNGRLYIGDNAGVARAFIGFSNNDGVSFDNQELYHSGNSVNPLDSALGRVSVEGDIPNTEAININRFGRITPTASGSRPFAGNFNALNLASSALTNTTIIMPWNDSSSTPRMYIRSQATSYTDWKEVLTDGNTNFNEFGGGQANDIVMKDGVVDSTTSALFYVQLNSNSDPSSLSLSPSALFKVSDKRTGASLGTTNSFALIPTSSRNVLLVRAQGLTGLTVDTPVRLDISNAGSKITVNF